MGKNIIEHWPQRIFVFQKKYLGKQEKPEKELQTSSGINTMGIELFSLVYSNARKPSDGL